MHVRNLIPVVMLCATAGSALAQSTVYAVDLRAATNRLLSFPVNAPANNQVATTTFDGFALDFGGNNSTLYGINQPVNTLGTIDLVTGAYNVVAPITGAPAGTTNFGGLRYNYANGQMYVLSSAGSVFNISTVDVNTGVITPGPTISGGVAGSIWIDIAIDNNGNAYLNNIANDNLYSVDLVTGAATIIGPTGFNTNFAQGMDFDPATNILYATLYTGGGTGVFASINTATGAATQIVSTTPWNSEMEMAIAPTPGAASLLALAGLVIARRRR